jgi:hypothetical protein
MKQCEVCRGARVIRLPLYREATVSFEVTAAKIEESYRDFPCPECAPLAAIDKVRVVECHFQADTRYEGEEGYRKYIVGHGAQVLAREIEKAGLIRMQHTPADSRELKRGYRLSVGVVSPKVVADLDAQREAAEDAFAGLVVEIAGYQIGNCGSRYGRSDISKRDAKHMVSEALKNAKDQRPKAFR